MKLAVAKSLTISRASEVRSWRSSTVLKFSLIDFIDWLLRNGLKGKEGVEMPPDVVANTLDRYKEAYQTLTGKRWFAACIE